MRNNFKKILANEKGLTLLEVLIGVLLLSIIATTFLHVFLYAFDNSINAQEITNYTYAAQAVMEELRASDYGTLMEKISTHPGREPFDINNDGTDDCFIDFSIEPYGVIDKTSQLGAFVHLIYLVDEVLVLDGDGNLFYTSAKNNTTLTLYVTPNSDVCVLTVNGTTTHFSRGDSDRYVCIMANLNYKDLGYNNNLAITGDTERVYVKKYGNDIILEEFTSNIDPQEYSGIQNLNSTLVKINVELFHDDDDTESFFDMSEIVEVSIGERDSLQP